MAGSTLYESYKSRLGEARFYQDKQPVLSDLRRDASRSNIDLGLAKSRMTTSRGVAGARSSFAAGRASGQRKVHKGNSSGAFASLGKLEAANTDALAAKAKEASDLDILLQDSQNPFPSIKGKGPKSYSLGPSVSTRLF